MFTVEKRERASTSTPDTTTLETHITAADGEEHGEEKADGTLMATLIEAVKDAFAASAEPLLGLSESDYVAIRNRSGDWVQVIDRA